MKPRFLLAATIALSAPLPLWAAPITVQVLGPDKKPLPGAQIRVRFWSREPGAPKAPPQKMQADAKGTARFEGPDPEPGEGPRSKYNVGLLMAWADGKAEGAVGSAFLFSGSNVITLGASGTARGLVVDAVGKPVEGAVVRLSGIFSPGGDSRHSLPDSMDVELDEPFFSSRTDASGRWSLPRVPLGGRVRVELAGAASAKAQATAPVFEDSAPFSWDLVQREARAVARSPRPARDESMAARWGNESGVLVQRPPSSITGRALDVAGAPLVGARVFASAGWGSGRPSPDAATTDARGEFRLERLQAGQYSLSLSPAKANAGGGVFDDEPKVSVAEGASASAGDLKLVPTGSIEVRLLDAATGKPIAGARVSGGRFNPPGGYSWSSGETSEPSDAQGRIVMRLAPGKYQVLMSQPPNGYFAPANSSQNNSPKFDLAAGETHRVEWKLPRGLAGEGRVLDEAGKPIPNVGVSFRKDKDSPNYGSFAQSDEAGKWRFAGFGPGAWKVGADEKWKVVRPATVSFPRAGSFDIVLAPIPTFALSGRVLDAAGKPIMGARVQLKISAPEGDGQRQYERTAYSGPDGVWRSKDVPESASRITVAASRVGLASQRAPVAARSKADNSWAVSDAILSARESRLAGRVLSAPGQPAREVQVLAAQESARVDGAGKWSLEDLPGGEVEVVAIGAQGVAWATTEAPNPNVSLLLKPPILAAPRDFEGAQAVLEDAWQTSRGSGFGGRESIPAVLAASDPDAALVLARGSEKKASARAMVEIVRVLLQKPDGLEDAQAWAASNVEGIEGPDERAQVLVMMAEALAEPDAASARKWLAQARASHAGVKEDYHQRDLATRIAKAALRLKEPDAESWFERAMKLVGVGGDASSEYGSIASLVAPESEAWAVRAIEASIKAAPMKTRYMAGPDWAVASAIQSMALRNIAGARRLLEKYKGIQGEVESGYEMDKAIAQVLGARAKAGEDADALAKEAASLAWQPQLRALALIAQSAPPERRVGILKRAVEFGIKQPYGMGEAIRVLRRLAAVDREAAKASLETLRAQMEKDGDRQRSESSQVASWAWEYRRFDARASRWAIEREWARAWAERVSEDDRWNHDQGLIALACAMMPLDIERARQLAERLPVKGYSNTAFTAQRAIGRWMLASDAERGSSSLNFWSRDLGQDERYSNDW